LYHGLLARILATLGSYDQAVTAYLKLLELGVAAEDEVEVRLRLARYFTSTGRTAQAQEQARRILAIDPDNAEARRLLH
jgi:tetratricopeptide (TPR) repeat protein